MSTVDSLTCRSITCEKYAAAVGESEIVSRLDMMERMCKSYSTVTYHLEKAVAQGLLNKQIGYISEQPGWLYALPQTMPRMTGM